LTLFRSLHILASIAGKPDAMMNSNRMIVIGTGLFWGSLAVMLIGQR